MVKIDIGQKLVCKKTAVLHDPWPIVLKEEECYEITDINNKILLLAFFGFYDDVLNYDIALLKNVRNTDNDNLYLIASYNGQIEVMEYLEKKGFDINIIDKNGSNAYLLASLNGQIEVMEYLKDKIIVNGKIKNVNRIAVEKTRNNTNSCAICYENMGDFICIPCGHIYMCGICANRYENEKCGICREKIDGIYKVFS